MTSYTNAQIREAILRAADHIEQNPWLYNYAYTRTPDCGTPACMWGWIGFFLGYAKGESIGFIARQIVPSSVTRDGVETTHLYEFRKSIGIEYDSATVDDAVAALRSYADKFWPAEKPAFNSAYLAFKRALAYELGDSQLLLTADEQREGVR